LLVERRRRWLQTLRLDVDKQSYDDRNQYDAARNLHFHAVIATVLEASCHGIILAFVGIHEGRQVTV
jgi:hypothetical protein